MIKILHVISDHKFVDNHIYRFEGAGIENRYVFLTDGKLYQGDYFLKVEQVIPFSTAFDNLIKEAAFFDLLFVYNLDYYKACIVNGIEKHIPVAWFFYGTELYGEQPAFKYAIHSKKTKKIIPVNRLTIGFARLKHVASRIKYTMLNRVPTYEEISKAMLRVNYFATFSKEEYDHLQANCTFRLPEWLPLPVYIRDSNLTLPDCRNKETLLLGHAATPDNNHIDIIDLLKQIGFKGKVIIPLSYGENKGYTGRVKHQLASSGLNTEILQSFMPYNAYSEKIGSCSAAVFNSFRQLAVGNIFLCLKNNSKVYLNEQNPYYRFLQNLGFRVFSVQTNLEADLKNNQLYLSPEETDANRLAYAKMNAPENNRHFLEVLIQKISKGKA